MEDTTRLIVYTKSMCRSKIETKAKATEKDRKVIYLIQKELLLTSRKTTSTIDEKLDRVLNKLVRKEDISSPETRKIFSSNNNEIKLPAPQLSLGSRSLISPHGHQIYSAHPSKTCLWCPCTTSLIHSFL